MSEGIFEVSSVPELVGADHDAIVGIKAASLELVTAPAPDVTTMYISSELIDIVPHETNNWALPDGQLPSRDEPTSQKHTILQQEVSLLLAALAVGLLIDRVTLL
jgi:hypothetical protein